MGHNAFANPFRLGFSHQGGRLARVELDVLHDLSTIGPWDFRPSSGLVFLLSWNHLRLGWAACR